jgi:hypothetical protein
MNELILTARSDQTREGKQTIREIKGDRWIDVNLFTTDLYEKPLSVRLNTPEGVPTLWVKGEKICEFKEGDWKCFGEKHG